MSGDDRPLRKRKSLLREAWSLAITFTHDRKVLPFLHTALATVSVYGAQMNVCVCMIPIPPTLPFFLNGRLFFFEGQFEIREGELRGEGELRIFATFKGFYLGNG